MASANLTFRSMIDWNPVSDSMSSEVNLGTINFPHFFCLNQKKPEEIWYYATRWILLWTFAFDEGLCMTKQWLQACMVQSVLYNRVVLPCQQAVTTSLRGLTASVKRFMRQACEMCLLFWWGLSLSAVASVRVDATDRQGAPCVCVLWFEWGLPLSVVKVSYSQTVTSVRVWCVLQEDGMCVLSSFSWRSVCFVFR